MALMKTSKRLLKVEFIKNEKVDMKKSKKGQSQKQESKNWALIVKTCVNEKIILSEN